MTAVATKSPNGLATSPATTDSDLRLEVMLVTPDLAATWLARGGKNRHLVQRRVNALAAAMQRGQWQLTGEAIKLDADGRIRDGQHRLSAVVKSGVAIQTVVVRNVEEAAFDVMDTGRARRISAALGMHGYVSTSGLAGATRLLIFFERFGEFAPRERNVANETITAPTVLQYLEEHDDVTNGVRMGDRIREAGLQGGNSMWSACMTLFLRINAEQAYQFTHLLTTGVNMDIGHPVLALRNRLLKTRYQANQSFRQRQESAALVIKAWNAFREDRKITTLTFRDEGPKPETFPRPV